MLSQADLALLYVKAGLKGIGTVFLLTDAQVPDEKFLVLINNLLASGEIPDLFASDELEAIISGVRNEVRDAGIQDTRENCWMYFIERVRRQLKVVNVITVPSEFDSIFTFLYLPGCSLLFTCWYYSKSEKSQFSCHCQLHKH